MVDFAKCSGKGEPDKPIDPLAIDEISDRASEKGENL
jgi:hypothetical protein